MDDVLEIHGVGTQAHSIHLFEGAGSVTLKIEESGFSTRTINLSPTQARYLATKLRRMALRVEA